MIGRHTGEKYSTGVSDPGFIYCFADVCLVCMFLYIKKDTSVLFAFAMILFV